VTVVIKNRKVTVTGPRGTLTRDLSHLRVDLRVEPKGEVRRLQQLHSRTLPLLLLLPARHRPPLVVLCSLAAGARAVHAMEPQASQRWARAMHLRWRRTAPLLAAQPLTSLLHCGVAVVCVFPRCSGPGCEG